MNAPHMDLCDCDSLQATQEAFKLFLDEASPEDVGEELLVDLSWAKVCCTSLFGWYNGGAVHYALDEIRSVPGYGKHQRKIARFVKSDNLPVLEEAEGFEFITEEISVRIVDNGIGYYEYHGVRGFHTDNQPEVESPQTFSLPNVFPMQMLHGVDDVVVKIMLDTAKHDKQGKLVGQYEFNIVG